MKHEYLIQLKNEIIVLRQKRKQINEDLKDILSKVKSYNKDRMKVSQLKNLRRMAKERNSGKIK